MLPVSASNLRAMQKWQVYLNGPVYLGGSYIACLVEGTADPFNNVHKDLISPATICALGVQHRLDDACRPLVDRVEQRRSCCFPLHRSVDV